MNDREQIRTLLESVKLILETSSSVTKELKDIAIELPLLKSQILSVKTELEKMITIVRDGNGQKSVLVRLSLIEHAIDTYQIHLNTLSEGIKELKSDISKPISTPSVTHQADSSNTNHFNKEVAVKRWEVYGIVAVAIISLVGASIPYFVSYYTNNSNQNPPTLPISPN